MPLRIACYRKQAGLSQIEMARRLGIHPKTLCRIERGKQYLTEAMEDRIATLLALDVYQRNHMIGCRLIGPAAIATSREAADLRLAGPDGGGRHVVDITPSNSS